MRNQENLGKLSYAQPKLCTYGGFAELTASGSGNSNEGSMSDPLKRP